MKVLLRNPSREIEMAGPVPVSVLLRRLDLNRESHVMIEDGELEPDDRGLTLIVGDLLPRDIDYLVDECPMAAGNKHLSYWAAVNDIEVELPGAKHAFFFGFLDRAADRVGADRGADELHPCERCGAPSSAGMCAFCPLTDRATAAMPIEMGRTRRARARA